jgi:hypothetical protein
VITLGPADSQPSYDGGARSGEDGVYDLDLQVGVEKFVVEKRTIGSIDAKEIAQTAGVVDRSKEKSSRTAGERGFRRRLHEC